MPKIRRVLIQNFRSIRRLEFKGEDLTILVGNNDSGKSNVLRALNLFFNQQTNPGQSLDFANDFNRYVNPNRRAKEILVEVDLELPKSYRQTNGDFVRWRKAWRESGLKDSRNYTGFRRRLSKGYEVLTEVQIPAKSNVHSLLERVNFEYVPAVRSAEFFRQLRGRIYGVIAQVAESNFRAKSNEFEKAIEENVATLIDDISVELNDAARLTLPNDLSGIFERLDFLNGDAAISLDSRGDGIKGRYIPLILKFIADKRRSLLVRGAQPYTFIWAYEEPEGNLEFRQAEELARSFVALAENAQTQIFVTTHSPLFFNLHKRNPSICSVCYAQHADAAAGTILHSTEEHLSTLDDSMGVMPIVAPYIQKAQEEIERLKRSKAEVEGLIKAQDRPTMFVEGTSDHHVLTQLIAKLRPDLAPKIHIQEPPSFGAGADYVADHLIAWGLVQRSRPELERKRAFGVLDRDEAGARAKRRVEQQELAKWVRSATLPRPPHLHDPAKLGLVPPVDIEAFYAPEWLATAMQKGWLVQRERAKVCSDNLATKILNGETNWKDLVSKAPWAICVEYCLDGKRKGDMARWVLDNFTAVDLEAAFGPVLELLDEAWNFLG